MAADQAVAGSEVVYSDDGELSDFVPPPPKPQSKPSPSNRPPRAPWTPPARPKVKTWIAFRLVDDAGKPVPDAAYTVTLPDGSVVTGALDEQGVVRFDEIDPGQCQITFPEIDAKEWK
jgi:hypothetical protein